MKKTIDQTRIRGKKDQLNKETIRKYENPEYRKAADEYERVARGKRKLRSQQHKEHSIKEAAAEAAEELAEHARSARQKASGTARSFKKAEREYQKKHKQHRMSSDAAEYGRTRNTTRKRRWNKAKICRNIIILLVILFLIFCFYFMSVASHFDKVDASRDEFAINDTVASELKGYRNIAILGVDARAGEPLDGSRTDAIIIMRIKKSNSKVQLISVMRDSYLKMKDNDGKLILDKITHAHHYGGGVDTCAALNRSLDLNISEFVIFNWKAVADTVDTLGGIDVNVRKNEIRDLNKWGPETGRNVGKSYHKITHTGTQTIDGVQATTYCRIRKTSGGDQGRGKRYKKVMSAVMKKAMTSPTGVGKLARNVLPEIRTNMSSFAMLRAVLRAPFYNIEKSYGWPKHYYGGLLGDGLWYAVPTTLASNVRWLHQKAFQQKDYTPSVTCRNISRQIRMYTGK